MKISILCSDSNHPVFPALEEWTQRNSSDHKIELVNRKQHLSGGDLLFMISCHEIITQEVRDAYQKSLVIHASDLPKGRGWSPHIWQIVEGKNEIVVTLLEAEDAVDSGAIWTKRKLLLEGHELWDEINKLLFAVELELMDFAVSNFGIIHPESQPETEPSYYPKRSPENSSIDPLNTIEAQFDLIRVCDPERFPAFFELRGHRYKLVIEKINT